MMFDEEREELIERLIRWGYLSKPEVIRAFRSVLRHEFVPPHLREYAYLDQPLPIGHGQTISAPSMIAIMLESLDLEPGHSALEIGTGSGYNAALLAEIVGEEGKVVSLEIIAELAEFGRSNLRRMGYGRVQVLVRDGARGYEEEGPWDRILVTACAPEMPKPLLEQLKVGGKIGAPIGGHCMYQTWTVAEKRAEGEISYRELGGCSFVPLIGEYGWR